MSESWFWLRVWCSVSSDSALCFRQPTILVLLCFGLLITLIQHIESVWWVKLSTAENDSGSPPLAAYPLTRHYGSDSRKLFWRCVLLELIPAESLWICLMYFVMILRFVIWNCDVHLEIAVRCILSWVRYTTWEHSRDLPSALLRNLESKLPDNIKLRYMLNRHGAPGGIFPGSEYRLNFG